MTRYIMVADINTKNGSGFEYVELDATTELQAVIESDTLYNPDRHYLIQICKATGRTYKEYGETCKAYTTIATKRSIEGGWLDMKNEHSYKVIKRDYKGHISYTVE